MNECTKWMFGYEWMTRQIPSFLFAFYTVSFVFSLCKTKSSDSTILTKERKIWLRVIAVLHRTCAHNSATVSYCTTLSPLHRCWVNSSTLIRTMTVRLGKWSKSHSDCVCLAIRETSPSVMLLHPSHPMFTPKYVSIGFLTWPCYCHTATHAHRQSECAFDCLSPVTVALSLTRHSRTRI